ncbi:MAG TPA: EAL domain-containing protein [Ideonella sp.]|nr:EAL domain-containing protein [Ideonella sp.]
MPMVDADRPQAAAPAARPSAVPGGRLWRAFRDAHLFDYNPAATRFWLLLALGGLGAMVAAGVQVAWMPAADVLQVLAWTLIVALAAAFPVELPRSKHSIAVGDVFVFLLLALHGAAPAALAAAIEGGIACSRSSARLSSRIATTATGAAAMYASGVLFELAVPALRGAGVPHATAQLAGLAAAALFYFPASTMPLMQVICLKHGQSLSLRDWFANGASVGAVYMVASMLAGVLALNAQQFGHSVVAVGVAVVGVALAMLRAHFRQQIAEQNAQEARVEAAEHEAVQNQQRFHAAFTHAAIGMAIVTPEGEMLQVNKALCTLLGCSPERLLGRTFGSLLHPGDAALLQRHAAGIAQRQEEAFSIEIRCLGFGPGPGPGLGESETWVSLHCGLFGDPSTAQAGLIYQLHDITSRRRAEGDLRHIAYHDSLTDLANRNCFHERLHVAVERHRQDPRAGFAVMCLDLDRFKIVNDSLGHPAGDQLLKEAAARISAHVRPGDLVARLGGDEFAVLLEGSAGHGDYLKLGERLLRVLEQPIRINGTEVRPAASIGLSFCDAGTASEALDGDELLRNADLAMYKAKADGKGRLALFDASLTEQLGHKLQLEADLRRAIGEGQLSLAYQPLYQLEPYRLCGFEALARWVHPVRGAISPGVFITLAEETGCIEALTRWAIGEAVRQHVQWRGDSALLDDAVMHVNVSGKDLARPDFVGHVRSVLEQHGLPARLLVLEITESTLMEHREVALGALAELRALGVKFGIDDFGTGYSSLAYLSTLPFDCLKIDRSFVIGMQSRPENVEIVRTVVSLGRSLNKDVVAEGIETHEQLQHLRQLGATIGQGYLLARPLSPRQVVEMLMAPALAPA